MRYNNREKLSGYFDLFILFVELDIFIWVLFELSYTLRPFVYEVGRILIILYILELIIQFLLNPRPKSYFRRYWNQYISLIILFFIYNRFRAVSASNQFLFLYSKLFLGTVEIILFVNFISKLSRLRDIWKGFKVSPAQLIIMSFATIILIGSFLLYLPYSRSDGGTMHYIDALFTSTSAVMVDRGVMIQSDRACCYS